MYIYRASFKSKTKWEVRMWWLLLLTAVTSVWIGAGLGIVICALMTAASGRRT
jgi:hypothetical protein